MSPSEQFLGLEHFNFCSEMLLMGLFDWASNLFSIGLDRLGKFRLDPSLVFTRKITLEIRPNRARRFQLDPGTLKLLFQILSSFEIIINFNNTTQRIIINVTQQ